MTLRNIGPIVAVQSTAIARLPDKVADPHYLTPAHRAWRAAVITAAAHRCQTCGRTNTRLFADHIRELQDGGAALDPANGQALCGRCHALKTANARARRMAAPPTPR